MQTLKDHISKIDRYPVYTVRADGRTFSYREAGGTDRGEPVILLLHGIGSGSGSWLHQFDVLAPLGRLIAWDAPGYGESTPLTPEKPVTDDYADALLAFCNALSLSRFVLIAHSLGAIIAARFARQHADKIVDLILAAPAKGYATANAERRDMMISERVGMMDRMGPNGMAESRAVKLLAQKASPDKVELVATNMRKLTRQGYCQAVHLLAQGDIVSDLIQYPHLVSIFCGSDDTITPPERVHEIATASKHATYSEIPDAGHACYIDEPGEFAALVEPIITQRFKGAP